MIQETSKNSYLELVNSDKLGDMQKRVLDAIVSLKEATDSEVADFLGFDDLNKVRPRRFELVEQGIVEENMIRECKITGRRAIAWKFRENKAVWDSKAEKRNCLSPVLFIRLLKDLDKCNKHQINKILEKLNAIPVSDVRLRMEGFSFMSKFGDVIENIKQYRDELKEQEENKDGN